ncbi:lysosomal thioesterase PPT2-A-like isoform X2 [Conger conger]|uniref:lysosomal thioesterase PPT2-A-like isoform X2 n=1 Tax=Conger conger TaxID=82655 RepID=UPI002A5A0787|nr:lysosomal thioesterase PPT2-A-like isoform X2 [Conger conger]
MMLASGFRDTRNGVSELLCMLLSVSVAANVVGYKPVIIVHGLFDGPKELSGLECFINKSHPGTNVTVIDLFDYKSSLKPLWKQVEGFKQAVLPILKNSVDGVHLICFSQETEYLKIPLFSKFIKRQVHQFCYLPMGQKISICNFWKDPHKIHQYGKSSDYLAVLDSERINPSAAIWKKNFLRIRKLVLIGGPDDGVITPWQSSHFGFYDENEDVVEMKDQDVYVKDVFGLKTLDARGDLVVCVFSGVKHTSWHSNETVYYGCIDKWLT